MTLIDFRNNLVTVTELLESVQKLQNVSDSSKFELIAKVLDEDHDGVLDKDDVIKVILSIYVQRCSSRRRSSCDISHMGAVIRYTPLSS